MFEFPFLTRPPQQEEPPATEGYSVEGLNAALQDPRMQQALLQIGVSLAQPPAWGQTPLGHIAQALGTAGEQIARREESERRDLDTESRAMQREAQATAAEARASAAAANAALRENRLGIERERLSLSQLLAKQRRLADAHKAYSLYAKNYISANPFQNPLQFSEWAAKHGYGDVLTETSIELGGQRAKFSDQILDEYKRFRAAFGQTNNPETRKRLIEYFRRSTGIELDPDGSLPGNSGE